MKKIWQFIVKYKVIIVMALLLAFGIFVFVTFKSLLSSDNGEVYGDRLEGIEKVPITESIKKEVIDFIKEDEKITEASLRIQGKIVNISIKATTKDNTIDVMKKKCEEVVNKFPKDIVAYYDFQFFVNNEDANYNLIGYKNKKNQALSFSNDEIVSEEEENENKEQ